MNIRSPSFPFVKGILPILLLAAPAWAAEGPVSTWHPDSLGSAAVATVIFGLVGIVLAIAGFKLFDACIKVNLEQEIGERQNIAAAILCAAMILGISVIIAATLLG
jgi:putative membrane protein